MCASEQTAFGVADMLVFYRLACGISTPEHQSRLPAKQRRSTTKEQIMSIGTILLIVVILILLGVLPTWPHARNWGYGPSGIVGVILVVLIVLLLLGRL
jgi:hypothetical protein